MKYKNSRFNFIYYRSQEDIIVYNTFSKALISLDQKHLDNLQSNNIEDAFSENEITDLLDNGIIVESLFDELEFLKYYNNKVRFSSEYFCLTIAPTLSCNFDCPYCFENKRSGKMSKEVQYKILEFIETKIKKGVKTLELTWYGGEPLLCFDVIEPMMREISRIANQNNTQIKTGMISNGYLITSRVVDFLEKYHIALQITLDGLKSNHDKRRYLLGGEGTFDKIFDNLKMLNGRQIDVYVRMNVDNYNQNDYAGLSEIIDELGNPRIILYPAVTENINERIEERKNHYMTDGGYEDFITLTRRNGLFKFKSTDLPISNDVSSVPDNRCYFCAAELENSCVIDEKGNVYKCWNEVGHEDFCFSLFDVEKINHTSMLKYMGDHTFNDERCKECVFLPICFGGCKFHRFHLNRYACAFNEESIIAYIEDSLLS